MANRNANATRGRCLIVAGLVSLVALSLPGSAGAARKYHGHGTNDPKIRVLIGANKRFLKSFRPKNLKIRCGDGTRGRSKDSDHINADKLPLERQQNGRWAFEQHVSLSDPSGNAVRVDLVGSFDPMRKRARGRFRIHVVSAGGDDVQAGTQCSTSLQHWKAKRRPAG